jgi:polysaccharide biosynthesis/export protein
MSMKSSLQWFGHACKRATSVAVAVLLVSSFGSAAAAQQTEAPRSAETPSAPHPREYRLGPGDSLSIRIVDVGVFEFIRVSNSGKIHVPYAGVLRVHDLTIPELEEEIAKRLREKDLIANPWVQIDILQFRAAPVYILGEIMMPGQFIIKDEMNVLDLLALAGGVNEFAIPVAYLYRRVPVTPEGTSTSLNSVPTEWADEVIHVDFEKAMKEGGDANVKLQGGDVLYVPERRKLHFYVVGAVQSPGMFAFPQKLPHQKSILSSVAVSLQPMRLSEALGQAGGPLKTAKLAKAMLVRFAADGTRTELPVDLAQVLRGRQPDVVLQPNDILYVPGSNVRNVSHSFLRMLTGALLGPLVYR